jgi:hypothetical protein
MPVVTVLAPDVSGEVSGSGAQGGGSFARGVSSYAQGDLQHRQMIFLNFFSVLPIMSLSALLFF